MMMQDHEGSEGRYVHGCKCRPCLDAHAATQRRYRAGAKARADRMKLELTQLRQQVSSMREILGQATP